MRMLKIPFIAAGLCMLATSCIIRAPYPEDDVPPPPYRPPGYVEGVTDAPPPPPTGIYSPDSPSSPTPPPPSSGGYPLARKTSNADQVISPYEPYNVIDVAGFRSGQLARDPSNQKIFRIP